VEIGADTVAVGEPEQSGYVVGVDEVFGADERHKNILQQSFIVSGA
jgi:hypothetical protein